MSQWRHVQSQDIKQKHWFLLQGRPSTAADCPERFCALYLWKYSKCNRMQPSKTCSKWPCSYQGVGLADLKHPYNLCDLFFSTLHGWVINLRINLVFPFRSPSYLRVTYLVVNVIWPQAADNHANECFTYGNPAEVTLGVVRRPFSSRLARVSSASKQFTNII